MLRPTIRIRAVRPVSTRPIVPALLLSIFAVSGFAQPAGDEVMAGPQFQVSSATGYDFEAQPAVAADADGNFVVVWVSYYEGIQGRLFGADGTPGGPQFPITGTTAEYVFEGRPAVASDADGDFVVVWRDYQYYQDPGTPYGHWVRGRRFDADGTPGGPQFLVSDHPAEYGYGSPPSVAADADGDFVVVWDEYEGLIQGRVFTADGTPGGPAFQISSATAESARESEPSVAADADGNFVVVWEGSEYLSPGLSLGPQVRGRRFAADGTPNGDPFLVGALAKPSDLSNPSALAAGGFHTCAIDDAGVTCWGNDDYGQSSPPAGLTNPSALAAGYIHTCAIDDAGVTCWGNDDYGQSSPPAGLTNPSALAAGYIHTCAIDDAGVTCWGNDEAGQSTVPTGLTNPSALTAGGTHTCAIADAGVACWGNDDSGQSSPPAGLTNPSALAAGYVHTCAIDAAGVTCWGNDEYGQSSPPAGLTNPSALAAGYLHTCAIDDAGVTCWGNDDYGQSSPPAGLTNPSVLAAGSVHTCAIDDAGVSCWGNDVTGQSTVPAGLTNPSALAAGGTHTCAIDDTGVTCWGNLNSALPFEGEPFVAADSGGNFVVVWRHQGRFPPRQPENKIQGRRFAADGTPSGPPFQVSSTATGYRHVRDPSVAADADGNFVVVWRDYRYYQDPATPYGRLIRARRFAANGAPREPQFQVSDRETGYAYERPPSVASDADGDFVVVWSEYQYAGPAQGRRIQGRQFDVPAPVVEIEIDIKPGSDTNPVNKLGRGLIPVAILGSETFDVADIDVTTLAFAPSETRPAHGLTDPGTLADHTKDANGDGFMDLLTHYRTQQVAFGIGDAAPCLAGALLDGTPFEGCDTVEVFGTRGARRSDRTH